MSFFWYFILFVFGTVLGSFLNAAALRVVHSESLLRGRSRCPHCGKTLQWFELIPIVSYLWLRGKCRTCSNAIAIRYLLVETVMGFYTAFLFYRFFQGAAVSIFSFSNSNIVFNFFLYFTISIVLFILLLIDYDTKLIFVGYTRLLTLMGGGFLLYHAPKTSFIDFFISNEGETIILALAIACFFFLLWMVTRGRGMGLGDAELVLLLALFLPFPYAVLMILFAFWIGAVFGIGLMLRSHYTMKSQIPFGPFLIVGFYAALLWGKAVLPTILPFF